MNMHKKLVMLTTKEGKGLTDLPDTVFDLQAKGVHPEYFDSACFATYGSEIGVLFTQEYDDDFTAQCIKDDLSRIYKDKNICEVIVNDGTLQVFVSGKIPVPKMLELSRTLDRLTRAYTIEKPSELLIEYSSGYIYYKTQEQTAIDGYNEFLQTCEKNGINMDNMEFERCTLRDANFRDIDTYSIHDLDFEKE